MAEIIFGIVLSSSVLTYILFSHLTETMSKRFPMFSPKRNKEIAENYIFSLGLCRIKDLYMESIIDEKEYEKEIPLNIIEKSCKKNGMAKQDFRNLIKEWTKEQVLNNGKITVLLALFFLNFLVKEKKIVFIKEDFISLYENWKKEQAEMLVKRNLKYDEEIIYFC